MFVNNFSVSPQVDLFITSISNMSKVTGAVTHPPPPHPNLYLNYNLNEHTNNNKQTNERTNQRWQLWLPKWVLYTIERWQRWDNQSAKPTTFHLKSIGRSLNHGRFLLQQKVRQWHAYFLCPKDLIGKF